MCKGSDALFEPGVVLPDPVDDKVLGLEEDEVFRIDVTLCDKLALPRSFVELASRTRGRSSSNVRSSAPHSEGAAARKKERGERRESVCVCVCDSERERERSGNAKETVCVCVFVVVCVISGNDHCNVKVYA